MTTDSDVVSCVEIKTKEHANGSYGIQTYFDLIEEA